MNNAWIGSHREYKSAASVVFPTPRAAVAADLDSRDSARALKRIQHAAARQ